MKRPAWNAQPWAPWEEAFLREHYGTSMVEDIARALRRGLPGVRAKVLELGLRCRTAWTPELDEFLTLLFPDHSATDLARVMGVTPAGVRARAVRLGLKKAEDFAAMNARVTTLARSPFKPEIAEYLRLHYPNTRTEVLADATGIPVSRIQAYASKRRWNKTKAFLQAEGRARATPDHPMRARQFQKGHVPANKGVKGWRAGGRSAETQFKKGQMPSTWKPLGSYRINGDGYLDRKVSDTGYPPRDWQPVHRLVWIEANGPVPDGHVVRFKPGMKTTDPELLTVDRVECISRFEHAMRNAWHAGLPPEMRQVMGARIALTRAMRKRQRELENME